MAARVLLVDDDSNNLNAMWRVLRQLEDIEVERFSSPQQALERGGEVSFDLVIADYRMPELDGARFFEAFRRQQPHSYRIIISGFADEELFRSAINRGQVHRFMEKPSDGLMLVQAVQEGLQQYSLEKELERLRREVERLGGLLRTVAAEAPELLPAGWDQE